MIFGQRSGVAHASERGSALLLAVFVLVLLTGMGLTLMFLTQNGVKMSQANLRVKHAFYLAEAGLEDARRTLYDTNGAGSFNDDLVAAAGDDNEIDFDPTLLAANFDAQGEVSALLGFGDDVPMRPLTPLGADPGNWYAAFLTNDPAEPGGVASKTDTNDRVMLTSVGLTGGRGMEIVQAIIEPRTAVPRPPGAAITLLGPHPSFQNGSSNAQSHDGQDCPDGGTGTPGLYVPIIGTVGGVAADEVRGDMSRPDHFESGPFEGEDTVGDLTDPTDPIVDAAGLGTIDPAWLDCEALQELLGRLATEATYYCDPDAQTCVTPATSAGSTYFIDGDVTVNDGDTSFGGHGPYEGVLVVTGTLSLDGNTSWEGIILVIGEGHVARQGGGNGHISGSMIVADIAGPNGIYGDGDDCSEAPDGFGSAVYDTAGGGDSEVSYCTGYITASNTPLTYRILEFLQR